LSSERNEDCFAFIASHDGSGSSRGGRDGHDSQGGGVLGAVSLGSVLIVAIVIITWGTN
jgi:hypothetical protein